MPPLPTITVYAKQDSSRLRYVLDWLLGERLGYTYEVTSDEGLAAKAFHCVAYGKKVANAICIPAAGLLWETGINEHSIERRDTEGLYQLYYDADSCMDISFDLFSAIFYMLSRYEEYLDFTPDRYERYPHTASVLYKDGVLERPVAGEWIAYLRALMASRWNTDPGRAEFSVVPTYDIDIAWKYRNKGVLRNIGGGVKDALARNVTEVGSRIGSGLRLRNDPWDAFKWMRELHEEQGIQPKYFILLSEAVTPYDKNISPHSAAMRSLVKQLAKEGEVGMHPSYYTKDDAEKLAAEKRLLETMAVRPVNTSRQHYIRLRFPEVYIGLIAAGITEDYSMGYSTHTGFRAGSSFSFNWYDLINERETSLRVHPFCFMDTTARFDMGLGAEEAFGKLRQLRARLASVGGVVTTIFHNFSLGTDKEWKGWREEYASFLKL